MNKIIPFNKDITFNENIGEITSIAIDDTLKFVDNYNIKGDLIIRGCHKYLEEEKEFSYALPALVTVDEKYDTKEASIEIDDFYYEIINDNILRVKIDLILDHLNYQEEVIEPINERLDFDLDIKKEDDLLDASLEASKEGDDTFNVNTSLKKDSDKSFEANFKIAKDNEKEETNKVEDNKKEKVQEKKNTKEEKKQEELIIEDKIDEEKEKHDVTDLFKPIEDKEKEYSIYRVYTVEDDDTLDSVLNKYHLTKEELANYNNLENIMKGTKLIIPSIDE